MPRENRVIERDCMECGKPIEIMIDNDDTYEGGHYFREVIVPNKDSDGAYEKTGEREGYDVVKWSGEAESYEY